MKTTIETISGKQYTVVWHKDECPTFTVKYGDGMLFCHRDGTHIATALPALPRRPKPEDARLIYRYMAEGLMLRGNYHGLFGECEEDVLMMPEMDGEITHVTTETGERVDVAIEGDV